MAAPKKPAKRRRGGLAKVGGPKAGKEEQKGPPDAVGLVSMAELLPSVEKRYGSVIRTAATLALKVPRIPSGWLPVDLAVAGGAPALRMVLISGRKGSGKSSLALKFVASYQRRCGRCFQRDAECTCSTAPLKPWAAFLDLEGDYSPPWAAALGVDNERVYVSQPEYAEQAVDIADGLFRTEEVDLLVVNSMAAFSPLTEVSGSALDRDMGTRAQLINKLLRKLAMGMLTKRRTGHAPTVILVNQLYHTMTQTRPGMPPIQIEPGGNNQFYASSLWLRMRHLGYVHPGGSGPEKPGDRTKPALLAVCGFKVQSSKVSPPGVEGEIRFAVSEHNGLAVGDCDDRDLILTRATQLGLIHRNGGGWQCGDLSAAKKEQLEEMVAASPEEMDKARSRILATAVEGAIV